MERVFFWKQGRQDNAWEASATKNSQSLFHAILVSFLHQVIPLFQCAEFLKMIFQSYFKAGRK
jgi:hypothetical protein